MGYLRATQDQYAEMRRLCRQLTDIHVSDEEAIKVVAQIHRNVGQQMKRAGVKHWSKNPPKVYFRNYRGSGVSYGGKIGLSHTSSIYTIVHELAHEYHGSIYRIVKRRDNKGAPDHHGPDYLGHLIFLKDMVLSLKVYKKWLDNPVKAIRTNPNIAKQKKVPLIERLGEDEFKVKVKPSAADALRTYTFEVDDEERFGWLEEKVHNRKKNFITLTDDQLCIFTQEAHYALGMLQPRDYAEDRSGYAALDQLTDAIADLRRKEEREEAA